MAIPPHAHRWGLHGAQRGEGLLRLVFLKEAKRRVQPHNRQDDDRIFYIPDENGNNGCCQQYNDHDLGKLRHQQFPCACTGFSWQFIQPVLSLSLLHVCRLETLLRIGLKPFQHFAFGECVPG